MSKVKIVQIAMGMDGETPISEYLDDKGRVWYPSGHWEEGGVAVEEGVKRTREWITEWHQLELPDEPES